VQDVFVDQLSDEIAKPFAQDRTESEFEATAALQEGENLFRSIVISANEKLRNQLVSALEASHVTIVRSMDRYPTQIELVRVLRAHATEVLFIDFESVESACEIVKLLENEASQVQIAAFHQHMDPAVLQRTMRAGVREFLTHPFEGQTMMDSLTQIKSLLDRRPVNYTTSSQIFSFLPSKAGVGTSTVALNVSAAVARKPSTQVLLADFDLNSGMMRFMLKLNNKHSIHDAVERSAEMDEQLWAQMVTQVGAMHVLHAGGIQPNAHLDPSQIQNLIAFARRFYQVLCLDLSGNLEKYSIELMQESKRVVLVCTPEIPSLHLTREKLAFLRECELADRVSIVVNRMHKNSPFSKQQVEDLLGHAVICTFPNDYHGINRATADGTTIAQGSPMGKSIAEFSEMMIQNGPQKRISDKPKFLTNVFSARPQLIQ